MSQTFKFTLGEIVRKVVVPAEGGMKWEAIEKAVKERFGIEDTKKIGLSYVDEDGDEITMCVLPSTVISSYVANDDIDNHFYDNSSSTQELNDLVPFPKPAKFNVVVFTDIATGAVLRSPPIAPPASLPASVMGDWVMDDDSVTPASAKEDKGKSRAPSSPSVHSRDGTATPSGSNNGGRKALRSILEEVLGNPAFKQVGDNIGLKGGKEEMASTVEGYLERFGWADFVDNIVGGKHPNVQVDVDFGGAKDTLLSRSGSRGGEEGRKRKRAHPVPPPFPPFPPFPQLSPDGFERSPNAHSPPRGFPTPPVPPVPPMPGMPPVPPMPGMPPIPPMPGMPPMQGFVASPPGDIHPNRRNFSFPHTGRGGYGHGRRGCFGPYHTHWRGHDFHDYARQAEKEAKRLANEVEREARRFSADAEREARRLAREAEREGRRMEREARRAEKRFRKNQRKERRRQREERAKRGEDVTTSSSSSESD
ncbi:hypothetical protein BT69DRAFT_1324431 [Atractiella rhizophila]|nr:hypothetical protein BT69DRAFT_1324431 [Atractiella rhizophila]